MPATQPLRRWLTLKIALVGMLPLAVVAALVLGVLLPQLRTNLEISHGVLAHAIAGQIEAHLLGAGRQLRAVAQEIRSQGHQPAAFWFGLLDAHAETGDVFAAIYIADADDTVYAVGLPAAQRGQRDDLLGLDLSRRLFLREVRARSEDVWSETFLSTVTGRLAVSLAIPIAEQILIGEIAIDRLAEFIGRLPTGTRMLTMVVDRQGQIIAHSQVALSGQQLSLGHLPIVHDALAGHLATRSFGLDRERFVGTPVSVPQLGWIVLVAQPHSEAFRPFWSTLWVLAVGALAALGLAILVAWVLARGLARRIGRYAAQAHAIAEGNYDQPWSVSYIREFDSLAGDLQWMSHAIRQRERDLATSEARYRSVIGNAPVIIFQFDEHGVFTLSEGKGLARIRLAAGEVVGQSLFELYHAYPEVCDYAHRAIGGEHLQFTTWIGDIFFDVHFNPVRNNDGHIQVMGLAIDITERHRAEEELRQANLVVENSPAMLFRWAAEEGWPVVFVSHNVKQLGYSPDELRNGSFCFASIIYPEDLERISHEVQGYSESGVDQFQQEYRIITRDGTRRWVDNRTVVERNAAGWITHYQGIVIDITERKAAEEALRQSRNLLQAVLDTIPARVFWKDPTLRYLGCNQAFARDAGVGSPAEMIGKDDYQMGWREQADLYRSDDQQVLASGQPKLDYEEPQTTPEGRQIWLQTSKVLLRDPDGVVLGILGTYQDITDRKQAEAELQRYREHLEELVAERTAELRQVMAQLMQSEKLAALGHLVAGVAHELNTPLGNTRTVASALGEELGAFAAAVESGSLRRSQVEAFLNRGWEAVDLLERNTARAADLIGHFKQVAVDQTSARRRRFDLRQTVEEVLTTLRPQFKHTAHRFEVDIPAHLELDSYPGPLEQVITNLVSNSLIHGFEGIAAGVIHICAAPLDADQVRLDYTDNGVGIPEKILNRLFEPFFTTKLGHGGSGLGLYIVYNLITGVLGGTIHVRGQPGHGATFSVVLPRTAPTPPTLAMPAL